MDYMHYTPYLSDDEYLDKIAAESSSKNRVGQIWADPEKEGLPWTPQLTPRVSERIM